MASCIGVTGGTGLHAADPSYDLVLRNARIVDGTGSPWFRADLAVRGDTIARLKDPAIRAKILAEAAHIIRTERGGGDLKKVVLTVCQWDPALAGKSLADVAQARGLEPTIENGAEGTLRLVERIGLADRGVLRAGMKADLTVFDPARVRDAATFEKPHQYPEGFAFVIVNGQIVFEKGAMTAARPGRVLYGPAKIAASR